MKPKKPTSSRHVHQPQPPQRSRSSSRSEQYLHCKRASAASPTYTPSLFSFSVSFDTATGHHHYYSSPNHTHTSFSFARRKTQHNVTFFCTFVLVSSLSRYFLVRFIFLSLLYLLSFFMNFSPSSFFSSCSVLP